MDSMRMGDLQGMQYLINQLKKYRTNEGYALSSTMYSGSGGFSSAFLSPQNITSSGPQQPPV